MHENKPAIDRASADPDDGPEWTEEMFDAAEMREGDKLVRPARGKIGPDGVVWFEQPETSSKAA